MSETHRSTKSSETGEGEETLQPSREMVLEQMNKFAAMSLELLPPQRGHEVQQAEQQKLLSIAYTGFIVSNNIIKPATGDGIDNYFRLLHGKYSGHRYQPPLSLAVDDIRTRLSATRKGAPEPPALSRWFRGYGAIIPSFEQVLQPQRPSLKDAMSRDQYFNQLIEVFAGTIDGPLAGVLHRQIGKYNEQFFSAE